MLTVFRKHSRNQLQYINDVSYFVLDVYLVYFMISHLGFQTVMAFVGTIGFSHNW